MRHPPLKLKVWGDYACFSRPEMKAERVSYDVMTPSAARGVLEAVYWKPEFRWRVRRIHVLRPIRRASFLRNEVNSTVAAGKVRSAFEKGEGYAYFADGDRTQRHTLALRDVAYVIEADVEPHGRGADVNPAKHRDIFRRRVARGQCFHRPYLGCREFAAEFSDHEGDIEAAPELQGRAEPLGRMLFDLRYASGARGRNTPVFFNAELASGVLHVPDHLFDEVMGAAETAR